MAEQYPSNAQEQEAQAKSSIEFSNDRQAAIAILKDLHLDTESPLGPTIDILYTRKPNQLEVGDIISYTGAPLITIDHHGSRIEYLSNQAELLRALEPTERPRAVLELLSQHMSFAYPSAIEKLRETNPNEAAWLAANISGGESGYPQVTLSEIADHGYGVCSHLSPLYLWLAQRAGLQGVLVTHAQKKMTNVTRRDTGQPLFKSVAVGQPVADHMWVELYLDNGEQVLIDPSTRLVGDTPETVQTIAEAGYASGDGFLIEGRQANRKGIDMVTSSTLTPAGRSDFYQSIQTQLSFSRISASFAEKFPEMYPPLLTGDILLAIGGVEKKGFGRFIIDDVRITDER